ncbi:MAG: hypothetical protein ACHQ49_07390 [Elusimicrobiota bacterium]
MEIIHHRVNGVKELMRLDPRDGAEIDIRSRRGRLILAHDADSEGPALERWLDVYARTRPDRLLILNPKEDGLDGRVLALLKERGIKRFFFLDLTFPSIVRLSVRGGERRVALRVSEHEPASAAKPLKRWVDWAWLDCFSGRPASAAAVRSLRRSFHVCLVSPELEGYPAARIRSFRGLPADAVCTKHPELWR